MSDSERAIGLDEHGFDEVMSTEYESVSNDESVVKLKTVDGTAIETEARVDPVRLNLAMLAFAEEFGPGDVYVGFAETSVGTTLILSPDKYSRRCIAVGPRVIPE